MYGASVSPKIQAYKQRRFALASIGIDPDATQRKAALQMQTMLGEMAIKLPKQILKESKPNDKFGDLEATNAAAGDEIAARAAKAGEAFTQQAAGSTMDFFAKAMAGENLQEPLKEWGDSITDAATTIGCEFLRGAGAYLGAAYGAAAGAALGTVATGGNPLGGTLGGYGGAMAGAAIGEALGDLACELLTVVMELVDVLFGWLVDFIFSLFEPDDPREVNDFGETLRPVGWTKDDYSDAFNLAGQIYLSRMKKRLAPAELATIAPNGLQGGKRVPWPKSKTDPKAIAVYTIGKHAELKTKFGYVLWYGGKDSKYAKLYDLDFDPWDTDAIKEQRASDSFFQMMVPILDLKEWKSCWSQAKQIWGKRIPGTRVTSIEKQWLTRRIRELGGGVEEWATLHDIMAQDCYGLVRPKGKSAAEYDSARAEYDARIAEFKAAQKSNPAAVFSTVSDLAAAAAARSRFVGALVSGGYNKVEAMDIAYKLKKKGSIDGTIEANKVLAENDELADEYRLAHSQLKGLRNLLKKSLPGKRENDERVLLAAEFSKSGGARAGVQLVAAKALNLMPPQTLLQLEVDNKSGKVISPKFVEDVLQNRSYADAIRRAMEKQTGGLGPVVGLAAIVGASFFFASPVPLALGAGAYLVSRKRAQTEQERIIDELKKGGDPFKGAWSKASTKPAGKKASGGKISSLSSLKG